MTWENSSTTHILEMTNSSKSGLKAFWTRGKTCLLLKRNLDNQAFSLIHKLKLLIIICFTLLEDLNHNKVSSSICKILDRWEKWTLEGCSLTFIATCDQPAYVHRHVCVHTHLILKTQWNYAVSYTALRKNQVT